jgi:hypothetical protein
MNIKFENLEKIEDIYKILIQLRDLKINQVEKRWLTSEELSDYIGYGKDSINKMVKENKFIHGIHYYKKYKKLLFDKNKIDNWIIGIEDNTTCVNTEIIVDEIISSLVA